MFKRLISYLFFLVMFFTFISTSLATDTEGDFRGFHWKFEKGILSFEGSGDLEGEGPWDVYQRKVKALEYSGNDIHIISGFFGYDNVKTIHLGEGVISYCGFPGNKPVKIIVDDPNFQFDRPLFDQNDKGNEVEFGPNVTKYIAEDGFVFNEDRTKLLMYYGKKQDVIRIPSTVKSIGVAAFRGNNMKEVRLPSDLEEIGEQAFSNCQNLKSLTIPGKVRTIGSNAFTFCPKLESIHYVNPKIPLFKEIGEDRRVDSITEYIIPDCLIVPAYYLSSTNSINHLIISEGNTICKIGEWQGNNLKGIYLPKSLKEISTDVIPYDSNVKLYVVSGSYAHSFAKEYGYPFKLVTPIKSIELSQETLEMKVKKTATLTVTVQPRDATSKKIEWFSSDEDVATVQGGKVKAVGIGECDIYCRGLDCELKTAACHIIVTK